MSALSRLKLGLATAGLACLVTGIAWAEQESEREYAREGSAAQARTNAERSTPQGQQYTAQFRGTQATAGQNDEVARFLAGCLLAKNQCEVELGQLAQQQAQNPEVKQFAQKMVQDHQQLVQKLQPLAGGQGGYSPTSPTQGTSSQFDAQRQTSDTTRLPGSPGAASQTPGARDIARNEDLNANQSLTGERAAGKQNPALHELAQIEKQIAERHKEAVREELQQKQGAEFDKCYVGAMIGSHMHALAALEVIEQQGPEQLRQIAQQAQPKVQQHLDHAKQLMKQLEGMTATSSQAERQSTRTQR